MNKQLKKQKRLNRKIKRLERKLKQSHHDVQPLRTLPETLSPKQRRLQTLPDQLSDVDLLKHSLYILKSYEGTLAAYNGMTPSPIRLEALKAESINYNVLCSRIRNAMRSRPAFTLDDLHQLDSVVERLHVFEHKILSTYSGCRSDTANKD